MTGFVLGMPFPGSPHDALMRRVDQHVRCLPSLNGGVFLENGGRFYLDTGGHPEMCTPEVDNPTDCVRYTFACEAIIAEAARALPPEREADLPLCLFKYNVDYFQPGVTWACHESYLYAADADLVPQQLIPHLVSRIYTGAGGLNPLCPGIQFSLSPRVHLFETVISDGSTSHRGIHHTRDEPLCRGYRRLDVICGDSVCSQWSLWLRVGTTALVVVMIEAGLRPGDVVSLRQPLTAMHALATDPFFRTAVELADGGHRTLPQIQRHYLEMAERHLEHPAMPPWAPEVCRRWRETLDHLEQGPQCVRGRLDWAMKYPLFIQHARDRRIDPVSFPHWNHVLTDMRDVQMWSGGSCDLSAERLFSSPAMQARGRELAPYLHEHGLSWAQAPAVLELRNALCEIDLRFGQLQPPGLFQQLRGCVDDGIMSDADIESARTLPPANTRACLRGRCVKRWSGHAGYAADWAAILAPDGRVLDLSDPFAGAVRWHRQVGGPQWPPSPPPSRAQLLLDRAVGRYDRGHYAQALELLSALRANEPLLSAESQRHILCLMAGAYCRLGRTAEAIGILDRLYAGRTLGLQEIGNYVFVYRFDGLRPQSDALWEWIRRADHLLARSPCAAEDTLATFLSNKGYALGRLGHLQQAEAVLRQACAPAMRPRTDRRVIARALADLADVLRLMGRTQEALSPLCEARQIHLAHGYSGELADFSLTYEAKLQSDREAARDLLRRARAIQRRQGNLIGLARTLLLEARLRGASCMAARRKRVLADLQRQVPALANCPQLAMILYRWDDWLSGRQIGSCQDFYWML